VLGVLDPDIAVMVLSADGRMKKSARDVRDRVDLFANGVDDGEAVERVLRAVAP
jgi:pilus assembly protein TadC